MKDPVKRTKSQIIEQEKIFANYTSDKRLVSRIYEVLLKCDSWK